MRTSPVRAGRRAAVVATAVLVCLTVACASEDRPLGAPQQQSRSIVADDGARADTAAPAHEEEADVADPVPATAVPEAGGTPSADLAPPDVAVAPAPAPAPSPPPPPPSPGPLLAGAGPATAGGGGSYSDQARQLFTAANGLSGRYLLYAGGIDPTRPVGLVVYADGTGEYGVDNPGSPYALGGPSGLVAQARARNMITLAVESPDQGCECWHTGDTAGSADYLADLVETRALGAYPVSETWLTGFSSGAQAITRFLVPRHPGLLRTGGGWVVFGGGGPPAGSGGAVSTAAMAGVRGHWFTGQDDGSVPLTASWGGRAGEDWYAARGVRTSHEWPAGVGHDLDGRLGPVVARILDEP